VAGPAAGAAELPEPRRALGAKNKMRQECLVPITDALHLTVSMALVVSTKQPFLVVHFRREAAEALKARPKIAQGDAPCGRLPGAIIERTFGAQNLGK